jgi:methylthioribose-1-phosphate isomerase
MKIIETVRWVGGVDGVMEMIDQRLLPGRLEMLRCSRPAEVFEAIQTLAVRGAPAIGAAAAFGVCLGLKEMPDEAELAASIESVNEVSQLLAKSRPTAVNLFWALNRMKAAAKSVDGTTAQLKQRLLEEAQAICEQDRQMCEAIGQYGAKLVPNGGAVLTHCNAGALATAGIGTALAPLYVAHREGKQFTAYADETRPLLQGARLTAWELKQAGIETMLVCDNMAARLMQQGRIQAVFVGADRIAANGDTANKIGTLGVSILARHYGVPFYVAAPSSTFDLGIADGRDIPIEERNGDEIRRVNGVLIAPEDVGVYNPAFDVTPAEHITAIITERGVIRPPYTETIAAVFKGLLRR